MDRDAARAVGAPSNYACSSQAHSLSRIWSSPVPHSPSYIWNLTTSLLQWLNVQPRTASCCSPLLIREMEESGLLLWGNVSQNSPVKHFNCLVLKMNKKSTPIINNLVENRPHLLTCHILCSRILYLQVSIPSLSKESIPNKKMLQSWRALD